VDLAAQADYSKRICTCLLSSIIVVVAADCVVFRVDDHRLTASG
jgi:hypothetical protein